MNKKQSILTLFRRQMDGISHDVFLGIVEDMMPLTTDGVDDEEFLDVDACEMIRDEIINIIKGFKF